MLRLLFAQFLEHLGDTGVLHAETVSKTSRCSEVGAPLLPRVNGFKILLF